MMNYRELPKLGLDDTGAPHGVNEKSMGKCRRMRIRENMGAGEPERNGRKKAQKARRGQPQQN
jgi:hypothetical protein